MGPPSPPRLHPEGVTYDTRENVMVPILSTVGGVPFPALAGREVSPRPCASTLFEIPSTL